MSSILVVDDDITILRSVERILSNQYKPIVMNEIDKFERCIQNNEFQVVFMDYDLKRQENGIDLAKKIKRINIFTRIVLFTGETGLDVVTNALNSGVIDAFLSKSITPTDLLNMVEVNIEPYRYNIEKIEKIICLLRSSNINAISISDRVCMAFDELLTRYTLYSPDNTRL
jgi:DNA-binding NtrC family response regulator